MTNLMDLSLNDFTIKLASASSTPGGGSVAALSGALGTALTAMVASLTIGRKQYQDFEVVAKEVSLAIAKLNEQMLANIMMDADSYDQVSKAYKLDKEDPIRPALIQAALKGAMLVPEQVLNEAVLALDLTLKLVGHSNPNAMSDLGVAALMLQAAALGAHLNVITNLNNIEDKVFCKTKREIADSLVAEAKAKTEQIYQSVQQCI